MAQIVHDITQTYAGEEYSLTYVENDPAPPFEHITLGLSRVIKQYQNSPKFLAFLTALLAMNDTCEALLQSMYALPDINAMSGVNLDVIGRIVGITRNVPNAITLQYFGFDGETDQTVFGELGQSGIGARLYDAGDPIEESTLMGDVEFRLILQAKITKNSAHATGEDIENVLAYIFGTNIVNVDDLGGMVIGLAIGRQLTQVEQSILTNLDLLPRPACVLIGSVTTFTAGDYFGFSDLNEYDSADIQTIAAEDGTVTVTIYVSGLELSSYGWLVEGVLVNIAGTGVADGGPYKILSVQTQIFNEPLEVLHAIITLMFYDSIASGSASTGTIEEAPAGGIPLGFGELSDPTIGGILADMFVPMIPTGIDGMEYAIGGSGHSTLPPGEHRTI